MSEQEIIMKLRPHHIIDIIKGHGNDIIYQPHPYGHSQHIVAPELLSGLDVNIRIVIGADDICLGCKHLMSDGQCDDVLAQLTPSPSKQAYNDVLDSRLFDHFGLVPNCILPLRRFLEIVDQNTPGIEMICTHPKEDREERLNGLINGLIKLGVRKNNRLS
jgi:hypothetical protein